MKPKIKFLLSVQVNDNNGPISYTVTPANKSWIADGLNWHEIEYDPCTQLRVSVIMTKPDDNQSHIVIGNLEANGVKITAIDQFGLYVRDGTNCYQAGTYGYMDRPGTYTFKIRFAPQLHNFVIYLLNICKL
jgi:hypothetical protein